MNVKGEFTNFHQWLCAFVSIKGTQITIVAWELLRITFNQLSLIIFSGQLSNSLPQCCFDWFDINDELGNSAALNPHILKGKFANFHQGSLRFVSMRGSQIIRSWADGSFLFSVK